MERKLGYVKTMGKIYAIESSSQLFQRIRARNAAVCVKLRLPLVLVSVKQETIKGRSVQQREVLNLKLSNCSTFVLIVRVLVPISLVGDFVESLNRDAKNKTKINALLDYKSKKKTSYLL